MMLIPLPLILAAISIVIVVPLTIQAIAAAEDVGPTQGNGAIETIDAVEKGSADFDERELFDADPKLNSIHMFQDENGQWYSVENMRAVFKTIYIFDSKPPGGITDEGIHHADYRENDQLPGNGKVELGIDHVPHKLRHHHLPATSSTPAPPITSSAEPPTLPVTPDLGTILTSHYPTPDGEYDEVNVTAAALTEEEFKLVAVHIFHEDPLGRSPDELRALLSNSTRLQLNDDELADTHRDYGGSYLLPLLKRVSYDNNSAPVVFHDLPVNVAVSLDLLHLGNFDSQQMEYTVDLELNMRWYDVRLANNLSKPIRVREMSILQQVWRPDPFFNSKFSYFHLVSFPNFQMRILPDGLVSYTLRATLLPSCQMTFCRHPHDTQRCDLILSSIAHHASTLNFSWHITEPVKFDREVSLPELRIRRTSTDHCEVEGKLVYSSCLRLSFFLERDSARYIVEKYIPSTLAAMFAWVAPYVPYNYEDVRIITPITVLLTLVQMEKEGGEGVRTSYVTSMDVWFMAMKAFSVLSLVESLVVLALIKRGRGVERQLHQAKSEYHRDNFLEEISTIRDLYHRLDAASRFLSPMVFVAFLVVYVVYIAQGDERACVSDHIY